MLLKLSPAQLIVLGFVLVALGAFLPFGMVLEWFESTLFLNLFAFASSLCGLVIGLFGALSYSRRKQRH